MATIVGGIELIIIAGTLIAAAYGAAFVGGLIVGWLWIKITGDKGQGFD